MKKWFTLLTLFIGVSVSLASCQQEDDFPGPAPRICRLDSIVHVADEYTYTQAYGYYPDGSLKSASLSPTDSRRYVYDGGKRIIEHVISDNYPVPDRIIYELASNGLATKSYYQYGDEEGNTMYDTLYYTFNPEGYLIKKVQHTTTIDYENTLKGRSQTVRTMVLRNGNTLEERIASVNRYGTPESEYVAVRYEYYEDQTQKDDRSKPHWLGKASKNLLKSVTYANRGPILPNKAYTNYQLNEKGYLTTAMVNRTKLKYYYTCL